MKKSKILIPALSIASVGAIVAPIVTSCNKGWGGIEVTETEAETAIEYLSNVTSSTNYSAVVTAEGKTVSCKVEKGQEKECWEEAGKIEYRRVSNGNEQKYVALTGWKDIVLPAAGGTDIHNPSVIVANLAQAIVAIASEEDFKFNNGAYVYTATDAETGLTATTIVVFQKIENKPRITHIQMSASLAGVTETTAIDVNYAKTTIADFPTE